MSVEAVTATRLAHRGLKLIGRTMALYEEMANDAEAGDTKAARQFLGHTKNITDAVMACVKVQAEEREQLEFEQEHNLGDLRRLIVEYLAALKPADVSALLVEAKLPPSDGKETHA